MYIDTHVKINSNIFFKSLCTMYNYIVYVFFSKADTSLYAYKPTHIIMYILTALASIDKQYTIMIKLFNTNFMYRMFSSQTKETVIFRLFIYILFSISLKGRKLFHNFLKTNSIIYYRVL